MRHTPIFVLLLFSVGTVAASGPAPVFVDATAEAGVTFRHATPFPYFLEPEFMTPGLAVADFDRDGYLDLFVHGGLGQNARLFLNDGDGTFTDGAEAWGVDLIAFEGSSVTVGDVDGNGYPDVYAGTLFARNLLYMNTGSRFVETAMAAGVDLTPPDNDPCAGNTFGASFGDVDLDGDLDLYTTQWNAPGTHGNRLFLNDGQGFFTDATRDYGLEIDASDDFHAFSPCLIDLDGDRWPDLPVAADFGTSRYSVNEAGTGFVSLASNGTGTDENGMGSAFGDYDNDGDLDWFVSSIYDDSEEPEGNWGVTGNRLYRNDGGHVFTDVTDEADVRNGDWGWGAVFGDLNHDGWLDLVLTNGFAYDGWNPNPAFVTDPMRLWMGDAGVFTEVATTAGITHTAPGKGLVAFDIERDGDLDLVVTSNLDDLVLYRNDTPTAAGTWLQFDLVPPRGLAPDGFGAVVRVTTADGTRVGVVHGGMTYMSQNPSRVHVAFPSVESVDAVHVTWPDGTVGRWNGVAPDQIMSLVRADVDGNGVVGFGDLVGVLSAWGPCDETCPADLRDDGVVNVEDLGVVLSSWSQ